MKPERRPTFQVKDTQHASRVIPDHERKMLRDNPYSGGKVIDRGESLPHPPPKKP